MGVRIPDVSRRVGRRAPSAAHGVGQDPALWKNRGGRDTQVGHRRSPSDVVPVGGKPTGLGWQNLDEVVWRPGRPPLARTEDLGRPTLQGRGLDLVRALRPAERCFQQAQGRLALRNIFAFEAVDDVSTVLRGRERPAQAIPDREDVGVVAVSEALVPRMVDLVHVRAGEHKGDRRIQPLR